MKETVIPRLGNDPSQDSRKGVLTMQIRSKIVLDLCVLKAFTYKSSRKGFL